MKNQKMYEADDKMISLIRDNYDLLQSLGSFGISLGFGDKTVQVEVLSVTESVRKEDAADMFRYL